MTSLVADRPIAPSLTLPVRELENRLRSVEPAAALIPPWLLQNIITIDRGLGRSPLHAPHRQNHVIRGDRLLQIARDENIALPADLGTFETHFLLARPEHDWLADRPAAVVLRQYWRMLFHARLDEALQTRLPPSPGVDAEIQRRIERLGRGAFDEARFVLESDHMLPPHARPREAYVEFAAVYLELHYFRPDVLPVYFPTITDHASVLALLTADVDAAELLRLTRLPGAADAEDDADATAAPPLVEPTTAADRSAPRERPLDGPRIAALLARADRAAALGNHVRAAILRHQVYVATGARGADPAGADVDALADRLTAALSLDEPAARQWREILPALLVDAADGWWNPEGRLLYDLQKACLSHEREIYSVGVVEWVLELGRRPLRRPQPQQRLVLVCKSLRSAARRTAVARLSHAQKSRLDTLLHDALRAAEQRVRAALRPSIVEALAGQVQPRHATEQVAERKLIEELLDSLSQRGFLTMGALRDAIARNQIKLHDVGSAAEFLRGDQLLRINRRLSDQLDGVYHGGEAYLRFFQKVSSLFFATVIGRFITRVFLMPLGGAFILLEAFDHTLFLLLRKLTGWHWLRLSRLDDFRHEHLGPFLLHNLPFVTLAIILLGVVNWKAFRHGLLRALRQVGKGIGVVLIDAPRWMLNRPAVQRVLKSRAARATFRYGLKPLAVAAVAWLVTPRSLGPRGRWIAGGAVFVLTNLVLNSPGGRAIEQVVLHWLRAIGARVTSDILGNLFSAIFRFFGKLLEEFDRMLYAVDEWLRFRAGQPRSSLVLKACLGVVWFYIAYVSRFVVNLLVEPQLNPIKHFPVVTVSHKIILPTVGLVAQGLEQLGLGTMRARTTAAMAVTATPGIFGFLAWELRANWRLYRANRPQTLRPVQVGSHGESISRLLRPGFHSGTVPKIFARGRRARRERGGSPRQAAHGIAAARKQIHALEHVSEAVAHFFQREMIALVNGHPAWRETPISMAGVVLAPTRIAVDLACPASGPSPLRVCFEQRAGWVVAGIDQPGWIGNLSAERERLLAAALLGIYTFGGVDFVKEHIEACFAPAQITFELSRDALTVWRDRRFEFPAVYTLREASAATPHAACPPAPLSARSSVLTWDEWTRIWDVGQGQDAASRLAAAGSIQVLPRSVTPRG